MQYIRVELSYKFDEKYAFDFASDLPDFRGVAFPRVVRFPVETSIAATLCRNSSRGKPT